MTKKNIILVAVLVIIVLLLSYFAWVNYAKAPSTEDDISLNGDDHKDLGDYRISAATDALNGTWISKDDSKFRREFYDNGEVIDRYEGDANATQEGTWKVFTKENPDSEFTSAYENGVIYLRMNMAGDKSYFKLIKVTPEELEMVYLERGNTLRFDRFQPIK